MYDHMLLCVASMKDGIRSVMVFLMISMYTYVTSLVPRLATLNELMGLVQCTTAHWFHLHCDEF